MHISRPIVCSVKGMRRICERESVFGIAPDADYLFVRCNLCGSNDAEVFAVSAAARRVVHRTKVRCRRCGLVYSNPQATAQRLKEFYSVVYPSTVAPTYIEAAEANVVPSACRFFQDLKKSRKPGRILDVGCATGHFLKVATEFGWEAYGVELSDEFSRYAREQLGLQNVFTGELHEAHYEDEFFDYIQIWHVLEHVPDAKGTLTEVKRILKNDGEILVGVPNIDEPYYNLSRLYSRLRGRVPGMFTSDQHTFEFTPHTLRMMLETVGFTVKVVGIYYNPLSETISACNSHKSRIVWQLVYYLGRIFPNRFGNRMSISAVKQRGW